MPAHRKGQHPGVEVRHQAGCATEQGRRCNCQPGYRAVVYSARDKRKITQTFPTAAQARSWRLDTERALRDGKRRAAPTITIAAAAARFVAGASAGTVRTRSGDVFKPSTLRGYAEALRLRVLPALGHRRLGDVQRVDVQRLVDGMLATGAKPSTIRNTANALRAVYRHAMRLDEVVISPCDGVQLPAVRGRRDRIAGPSEAATLLSALDERDRALWAAAFYTGLRRGELRGLPWDDVDLTTATIQVRRSVDRVAGDVAPKSAAGTRTVPIIPRLREYLVAQRLRTGGRGAVFPSATGRPFDPESVQARADRAWAAGGLTRITLHECRHTFASLMIAAGVNVKALSTLMGHASITVTLDRYGHLLPGSEQDAGDLLDAFLTRAEAAAR